MFEINLTYNYFKDIVSQKRLLWQYTETDKIYNIFAVDEIIKYNTIVYKDTEGITGLDPVLEANNKEDFETNYKPISNRPLINSLSGFTSFFTGKTIQLSSEETTKSCEWQFPNDVYLNKMLPIPQNAELGDTVDLLIVANINGEEVIVGQYGDKVPLLGNNPSTWFYGQGAGLIPAGAIVRCVYTKVGQNPRNFAIIAEFLI